MAQPTLRKTPGVYIEEIALFPPSVAPVETAIPAFIGYTEKAKKRDQDLTNVPTRITSLLEYEQYFGEAKQEDFKFDVNVSIDKESEKINSVTIYTVEKPIVKYYLHYAMKMFFANGGGPCYIISVGSYEANAIVQGDLDKGLAEVGKIDEVTIIVAPDAVALDMGKYTGFMDSCLAQCEKLQDRVTIMDIPNNNVEHDASKIEDFRNKISNNISETKYGAVYYPYLESILTINYRNDTDSSVLIRYYAQDAAEEFADLQSKNAALVKKEAEENFLLKLQTDTASLTEKDPLQKVLEEAFGKTIPNNLNTLLNATSFDAEAVKAEIRKMKGDATTAKTKADKDRNDAIKVLEGKKGYEANLKLHGLKTSNNLVYNAIIQKIQEEGRVTLPPSSTVAGIYANVDRTRGVWKAPANVSLSFVIKPIVKITDDIQDGLNVHTEAGKSINAIRSFTGRGTLIWGARTLAGNDNEWRYISVRRFFNFVEESVKKASARFVFEPNSKNTWVKVKAMIENFLIVQWRAGALVGDKPEHAFYVKVGLNETMTAEDILNGYMVVEIGMAVVRPAEFIILQFSHKMQES